MTDRSMEVYESFSRALLRRRYRRIDAGGIPVKRKRVKVANLQQQAEAEEVKRRSALHRSRLQSFRLRLLAFPQRLLEGINAACAKLVECAGGKCEPALPKPVLVLPRNMPLRSSNNDVVNEVWFQQALRRSIAEGRITVGS